MSDLHPTKDRSSEAAGRSQTFGKESDAENALFCSEYHQNQKGLACHDARHWQGACRLPDCRLGLLEGKVTSSCCRSGSWRKSLEEPPSRSKSMAMALKRHESVAMLPHLLSKLAVTRTRSEPCIFGKDFLRITLPLPGEPKECEASASCTDPPETFASKRVLSCDAVPLIVSETREEQVYDETMTKMDASSRTPCLWGDIAGPIPDIIDVSEVQASSTSIMNSREDFNGAESSRLDTEQTWNAGDCAAGSEGVGPPASSAPQWDDWWTVHPEELSVRNECTGEQRVQQHRNKFKGVSCTPEMVDDIDEAALDEGYLVLDEQEDEQSGSGSENEAYHNTDDEGNSEHVHSCDAYDFASEESPTDWRGKAYKEDDIWSDEHFVSSQVKGFPPPISILANETHPGLPSHVPKTLWRSVKRNNRFVLQEVQARPREFFQATREYGRLRLQLVRPDSDSTGSFTETASVEDKEGSLISSESIGNFTGVTEICQQEVSEVETPRAGPSNLLAVKTLSQGIQTFQVVDEKLGRAGSEENCVNSSWGLTSPSLLYDEQGSRCQVEHSGANDGHMSNEVPRRRTSADAAWKERTDQMHSDVVVEGPFVADCSIMIKGTPREKVNDEGFGRMSSHDIVAPEMRELDICNHASGMSASVNGSEEQYRQDYQHPRFSATYGFDNNLNVLSPSQALIMQVPIQPAVR